MVPLEVSRAILQCIWGWEVGRRSADACLAAQGGDKQVPCVAEADTNWAHKLWISAAKYLHVRPYFPCAISISFNTVSMSA